VMRATPFLRQEGIGGRDRPRKAGKLPERLLLLKDGMLVASKEAIHLVCMDGAASIQLTGCLPGLIRQNSKQATALDT
jgi:hypothetical protein